MRGQLDFAYRLISHVIEPITLILSYFHIYKTRKMGNKRNFKIKTALGTKNKTKSKGSGHINPNPTAER